ncbi:hypothetical protein ACQUJV_18835, partial [Ralstonia pseudosolanacearum]
MASNKEPKTLVYRVHHLRASSGMGQRRLEWDLPPPNFFPEIAPSGNPQGNVRKQQLRHELRQWLESLEPDEIERRYRDGEAVPTYQFEDGGCDLPPINRSTGKLVESVFGEEDGHEEAVYGSANHRVP